MELQKKIDVKKPSALERVRSGLRKLSRNKPSLISLVVLLAFLFLALFPKTIMPYSHNLWFKARQPPSFKHLFGTDTIGRDVFSNVIWGIKTTFYIGTACVIIELVIGFLIGGLAGISGGWIDDLLMRFTDLIMALPTLIILILAVSMFEVRSLNLMIGVMGFFGWPQIARVMRSQILWMKTTPFVEASRAMGASTQRIMFRHILPNIFLPTVVIMTIHFAGYVLWEASLTFLGLGDPTSGSWGVMIMSGKNVLKTAPWVAAFPGLFLFIMLISLQLLGDGLRDLFDIKV